MLQKYGIISLKGTTNDIKRILEHNDFIENEDFQLRNVAQFNSKGGCTHKNEYFLHPRAFKICLMRSLKTKKYAKYYLLLEECIKYFNDFQIKLKEKYFIKLKNKIVQKDNKICKLEEKRNILLKTNEQILEDNKNTKIINEKILKRSEKMELQLNKAVEKLDITNDKFDNYHILILLFLNTSLIDIFLNIL